MNSKNYDCINKFVDDVVTRYYELEKSENAFSGINIVCHYDEMIEILNSLVKNTNFTMSFIELSDPEWDGYTNEFILTIDDDGYLHCQKAIYEGHTDYIFIDGFAFVSSDTNSKFVVTNKDISMFEFSFDDESYDLELDTTDEGLHGFTRTESKNSNFSSTSFYSTDLELVERMAKLLK